MAHVIRSLFLSVALTATVAPSVLAQAQSAPLESAAQRGKDFDAADKNKDGQLDKAEWLASLPKGVSAHADQVWKRMDAENRGFITRRAYVAFDGRPGAEKVPDAPAKGTAG
jgi:hypothetical protein